MDVDCLGGGGGTVDFCAVMGLWGREGFASEMSARRSVCTCQLASTLLGLLVYNHIIISLPPPRSRCSPACLVMIQVPSDLLPHLVIVY